MNSKIIAVVAVVVLVAVAVAAAVVMQNNQDSPVSDSPTDTSRIDDTEIDTGEDSSVTNDSEFIITCSKGTDKVWTESASNGETIYTFSGLTENSTYSISGNLTGSIVIDAGDYDLELDLEGVTITSSYNVPINIQSGDDIEISAKKDTTNYIYDKREEVSENDISAALYSKSDLTLKGKGKLVIVSDNNNGIHSTDDLDVKNLTLYVTCIDNALKGHDSVNITSGTIVLNALSGDGIKTTSTDLSTKGKQRGTVTINSDDGDTSITIKAYCDGIDASYDVYIEETANNKVSLDIIAGTSANSTSYLITGARMGDPSGMGGPGRSMDWGGQQNDSWRQGGPDSDGNKNKASYSCKGIKADNEITIISGTIIIDSYDDSIHTNNDSTMESGVKPTGNVSIQGGTITLNSKDDAIHADGSLTVSGGTIDITSSYEGLEGTTITISGGNVSVISSDDGVNATATSGTGITLSGGYLYVYAGGDGIDSNSKSSREGILFKGTDVVVISTSSGNSSIDTEAGYTYTSGKVLAACPTGMTQQVTQYLPSGSSVSKNMSLSKGSYLTVTEGGSTVAVAKIPVNISNGYVVYMNSGSATISTVTSTSLTLDDNGGYI